MLIVFLNLFYGILCAGIGYGVFKLTKNKILGWVIVVGISLYAPLAYSQPNLFFALPIGLIFYYLFYTKLMNRNRNS